MKDGPESITIDTVKYLRADSLEPAPKLDGMPYVIVRADRAGAFAGYMEKKVGDEVLLRQSRRLWYWSGAASLSQLAIDGVSAPESCKFPEALSVHTILGVIEVLPCTEKARKSISEVKKWQH
jgi:hypothetical protein